MIRPMRPCSCDGARPSVPNPLSLMQSLSMSKGRTTSTHSHIYAQPPIDAFTHLRAATLPRIHTFTHLRATHSTSQTLPTYRKRLFARSLGKPRTVAPLLRHRKLVLPSNLIAVCLCRLECLSFAADLPVRKEFWFENLTLFIGANKIPMRGPRIDAADKPRAAPSSPYRHNGILTHTNGFFKRRRKF